jgi:hypothetical protein
MVSMGLDCLEKFFKSHCQQKRELISSIVLPLAVEHLLKVIQYRIETQTVHPADSQDSEIRTLEVMRILLSKMMVSTSLWRKLPPVSRFSHVTSYGIFPIPCFAALGMCVLGCTEDKGRQHIFEPNFVHLHRLRSMMLNLSAPPLINHKRLR